MQRYDRIMTKAPIMQIGDAVPWFVCAASNNPRFHFDSVAGHYVVLSFFGSLAGPAQSEVHQFITQTLRPHFDDAKLVFFGVVTDADSQALATPMVPGIRYFWDTDTSVSALYHAMGFDATGRVYTPYTLVLDPALRIVGRIGMHNPQEHNQALARLLQHLPPIDAHAMTPLHAPVLIVPRVFEPSFCRALIEYYQKQGGVDSGFMREKDGKTIAVSDHKFKRRNDCEIEDAAIRQHAKNCLIRRLFPEITKAFQFTPTVIERYIVACYDAQSKGFFRPHRDNTTKATLHRKFAVTMNLNAEEFEGGELRFPEFGSRTYRAPSGGAVVFSCSLLHEALPVTRGERYAFLPFLYDMAGAKLREENLHFLDTSPAQPPEA